MLSRHFHSNTSSRSTAATAFAGHASARRQPRASRRAGNGRVVATEPDRGSAGRLRPVAVPGVRGHGRRGDPDHVRRHAAHAARAARRGAVRGNVGDPRWLQAPHRDVGRGCEAGAGRGDGVDVPSLLTQFGAYGDPERDPRMNVVTVAYLAVLRDVGAVVAARTPQTPRWSRSPTCSTANRPGVRPSADRARRHRARPRRARGHGHRDGVRRDDVHPGRAAGGVRGRLGRAARRRELPAQHRRRGRLGDPDRPPSSAGPGRRQARGALSGGRAWSHGGPIHRFQREERKS